MTGILNPTSTADTGGQPPPDTAAAGRLAEDQRQALSSPLGDPLWLLARQWQTGAFVATDGGSPVRAALSWSTGLVLRSGSVVQGPLEPQVEPEPAPPAAELDSTRRVKLATELLRRLRDAGLSAEQQASARAAWLAAYPIRLTGEASAWLRSAAARLPDPVPILSLLSQVLDADGHGDSFPALPGADGYDPATRGAFEAAVRGWFASARGAFTSTTAAGPATRVPDAWDGTRLVYHVDCEADLGTGAVTFTAADYDGTGLDWFSFDRSALAAPAGGVAVAPTSRSAEVHPGRVSYAGMPRPRWWELEDGDVNLDALRASADPARAVLATFAHSYSNDWFVCPLILEPGWALITSLTVTDTFGTQTDIAAVAAVDGDAGPWRLWDLDRPSGAADAAAGLRLCWPVSPPMLDGPPVEEVLLARDEMANLAWVIELKTQDGDGLVVDRYQRWLELRSDDDTGADPSPGASDYRLGSTVPDFWYPLLASGQPGSQVLRLAALPAEATGVSDAGVQGLLVPHTHTSELSIHVVSRQGHRVIRRDRLAVGTDGVQTWRVRVNSPGDGDASSGLRFDRLI